MIFRYKKSPEYKLSFGKLLLAHFDIETSDYYERKEFLDRHYGLNEDKDVDETEEYKQIE